MHPAMEKKGVGERMAQLNIDSPRAKSGSAAAASDISVSRISWLEAGSSIDIARACCSSAFSSSCHKFKSVQKQASKII